MAGGWKKLISKICPDKTLPCFCDSKGPKAPGRIWTPSGALCAARKSPQGGQWDCLPPLPKKKKKKTPNFPKQLRWEKVAMWLPCWRWERKASMQSSHRRKGGWLSSPKTIEKLLSVTAGSAGGSGFPLCPSTRRWDGPKRHFAPNPWKQLKDKLLHLV